MKLRLYKFSSLLLVFSLLLPIFNRTALAEHKKVGLVFNGYSLTYQFITEKQGKTSMIALQGLSALLFCDSRFEKSKGVLTVSGSGIKMEFKPGNSIVKVNGRSNILSAKPYFAKDGLFYIPLDFAKNISAGIVAWDEENSLATASIDDTRQDAVLDPTEMKIINLQSVDFYLKGSLAIVNKEHVLPAKYVPSNLKGILQGKKYVLSSKTSTAKLDSQALDAAVKMFDSASRNGVNGLILSNGYRSYSLQQFNFQKKLAEYSKYDKKTAFAKASSIVAPPGQSEHQTGLAMDLTTSEILHKTEKLLPSFAQTPQGKWVSANSWKYGFVIRYPSNKTSITGIVWEPWHLRYVGTPHAEIMTKKGLCLEEYILYLQQNPSFSYTDSSGRNYRIIALRAPHELGELTLTGQNLSNWQISSCGSSLLVITIPV